MLKRIIIILFFVFSFSAFLKAQNYDLTNTEEIDRDIIAKAQGLYPGEYINQRLYLFDQKQAYRQVLSWKRNSQYQLILTDIINMYYPDFIRIVKEYNSEIFSYELKKKKQEAILTRIE